MTAIMISELLRRRLPRFLGWWLGFGGLFAMAATCPCCGKPGCPAGAGLFGLLAALGTLLAGPWRRFRHWWWSRSHAS